MESLPVEILRYVLQKLPGKDILKCRRVCKLWKEEIDDSTKTDEFWRGRCAAEYTEIYLEAKRKAMPSLTWCEMYKSLSLWSTLESAIEQWEQISDKGELMKANRVLNVEGGMLVTALNHFSSIILKDVNKKEVDRYVPIYGWITKYHENDQFIAVTLQHGESGQIFKIFPKEGNQIGEKVFEIKNVTDFICVNNTIYYMKRNSSVYRYNFNVMEHDFLFEIDNIVLMSYKDNKVIAIHNSKGYGTTDVSYRTVFYDEETGTVTQEDLPRGEDIFQKLLNYDFTHYMVEKNWCKLADHLYDTSNKIYQHIEHCNFNYISAFKQYGDIIFIGSDAGHVLVFHKPYNQGKIDFNIKPVKIYHMFQLINGFGRICHIDVVESKTGPILIISLNGNIFALTLTYACEEKNKNNVFYLPSCPYFKR